MAFAEDVAAVLATTIANKAAVAQLVSTLALGADAVAIRHVTIGGGDPATPDDNTVVVEVRLTKHMVTDAVADQMQEIQNSQRGEA